MDLVPDKVREKSPVQSRMSYFVSCLYDNPFVNSAKYCGKYLYDNFSELRKETKDVIYENYLSIKPYIKDLYESKPVEKMKYVGYGTAQFIHENYTMIKEIKDKTSESAKDCIKSVHFYPTMNKYKKEEKGFINALHSFFGRVGLVEEYGITDYLCERGGKYVVAPGIMGVAYSAGIIFFGLKTLAIPIITNMLSFIYEVGKEANRREEKKKIK